MSSIGLENLLLEILPQFLDSVLYVFWPIFYVTLFCLSSLEIKYLLDFRLYGIPLHTLSQYSLNSQWIAQISSLFLLVVLGITEIFINPTNEFTVLLWLHTFVELPLVSARILCDAKFKISTSNAIHNWIEQNSLKAYALVQLTESVFEIAHKHCSKPEESKICLIFLSIRFVIFTILMHQAGKKFGNIVEQEEKKNGKILSTLAKYYPLRNYLVPSTMKGKIYLTLLIGATISTSTFTFLSDLYYTRIVNSLQIEVAEITNKNTNQTGELPTNVTLRLDFRWDYIIIYFVINFFRYHLLWVYKRHFQSQVEKESWAKLQVDLFCKIQALSLRWHLENQATDVFAILSSASSIGMEILDSLFNLVPEILDMVVTIIYLLNTYTLGLSSIVVITVMISTSFDFFILKNREKAFIDRQEAITQVIKTRAATFENYETMKYFTNEEFEKERYAESYFKNKENDAQVYLLLYAVPLIRQLIQNFAEMIVILIVVNAIIGNNGLTVGDYVYFQGVFHTIFYPLSSLSMFLQIIQENGLEAERISEVLNLVPEIIDEPNAPQLEIDSSNASIEFRNVNFAYVPEREIIKDLNVFIPAGSTVALVGRSGAGKSTITKLLFRFYNPTSGEIYINGQNIQKVQCFSLRKSIGVVPQDVVLFHDTIMNNIKYGDVRNATDEDVIEAAKCACLHDRIETFPEKYETEVGSRGLKMSGGEKQRIAIARTIVKNPPIILLDEATSSLDTQTEKQIQKSIEKLCENRTTIIIAHRLSTIVNVNTILVFDEGRIVESGTHLELLEKAGIYASMWYQQFHSREAI